MDKGKRLAYLLLHGANLLLQFLPLQSHPVAFSYRHNHYQIHHQQRQTSEVLQESCPPGVNHSGPGHIWTDVQICDYILQGTSFSKHFNYFFFFCIILAIGFHGNLSSYQWWENVSQTASAKAPQAFLHGCLMRQTSNLTLVLHRKASKNIHQEPKDLPCYYKRSIRMEYKR